MVLGGRRDLLAWLTRPLVPRLKEADPNTITWVAFPFAVAGGVAFYYSSPGGEVGDGLLLLAAALVALSSLLDSLDGAVAREFGKTTAKGDYLDHVLDRFADVAIIGGLALSPWVDARLGLGAVVAVLLASYMGTQAQAVHMGRNYTGLLGRAERMLLLIVTPVAEDVRLRLGIDFPAVWPVASLLEVLLWWFLLAGLVTAVQRFHDGMRWFRRKARGERQV